MGLERGVGVHHDGFLDRYDGRQPHKHFDETDETGLEVEVEEPRVPAGSGAELVAESAIRIREPWPADARASRISGLVSGGLSLMRGFQPLESGRSSRVAGALGSDPRALRPDLLKGRVGSRAYRPQLHGLRGTSVSRVSTLVSAVWFTR